jgi:putative exporter of polyketide antibiotics
MKAVLVILVVVAVIVGLLFTLRSSRNVGTPSRDVLERAQERAREQAAKDRDD